MPRLLALGVIAALAVAGCASGPEEAPTTTTSTTAVTGSERPAPVEQAEAPEPPAEQPRPRLAKAEPAPSESEFRAAADAVCAELNAAAGSPSTATLPEIESAAQRSHELVTVGLERLRELEPAPGLEVVFGQFTDAIEDQQEIVAELAGAAATGDVGAVNAVALEVDAASERKRMIALAAGLVECGSMR
jgi:hypothetical protein